MLGVQPHARRARRFGLLCAILAASLSALASSSAADGPSAWTPDPLEGIAPDSEGVFHRDPDPVHLVAPRNGRASGPVVVRNADLRRIRVSPLRGPDGSTVPTSQIQVRFATDRVEEHGWSHPSYDALLPRPQVSRPGPSEMTAIWITVHVAPETRAGEYRGTLEMDGLDVPVRLRVADYRLPDPRDWVSHAYLIQSPEAVAWTYEVDLWPEPHFERMEPSLKLLGELGNNVAHVAAIRRLHFGNDHAMLVFRREGDRIVPDFRFVDRFLALYHKHVGPPRVLNLYLWEPAQNPRDQDTEQARVTFVDDRGRLSDGVIPMYGLGKADDTWRQVIEGMRHRMRQLDWNPDALMLGAGADRRPGPSEIGFFNGFEPPLQWVVFSHWRGDPVHHVDRLVIGESMDIGYAEGPDPVVYRDRLGDRLRGGWREDIQVLWASSFRAHIRQDSSPTRFRCMPDLTVSDRYSGFTRVGLDGWRAPHPADGRPTDTIMRWRNGWFRLFRHNPRSITAPGPRGAVATVRYEMLREGIQEVEARILLERTLDSGTLPEQAAREVEAFLREWIQARYVSTGSGRTVEFAFPPDWRDHTFRLFALAGRVTRPADPTDRP